LKIFIKKWSTDINLESIEMTLTNEIEMYLRFRVEGVNDFVITPITDRSKNHWDRQLENGINGFQMKWNIKKNGTTSNIKVGSIFFARYYGDYVSCHMITKIDESCHPENYWESDDSWQVFCISKEFHRIKWTTWQRNVTSCIHKNNLRATRRIARNSDIDNIKQLLKLN
jgi:hypothetical protein